MAQQAQMQAQLAALRAENARLMGMLNQNVSVEGGSTQDGGEGSGPRAPKKMFGEMKLWAGTWNMGAVDPFQALGDMSVKGDEVSRLLSPFVPKGLDVYVLAVQEGVCDKMYEAFEQYTGCFRLPMHRRLYSSQSEQVSGRSRRVGTAVRVQSFLNEARARATPEPLANTADMLDRVWGRGDGALLIPKFTGIAVFVAPVVAPYVRLLSVYKHSFGASEGSKGGVGVALGLYDVTMAFVSTHQASKKPEMRRKQFQELVDRLGGKLGCRGFGLTDAFHHTVWMGDLNTHCRGVSAADALELIRTGRHLQLLLQHDELLIEKEAGTVFHEFEEPLMAPSFYPTYKRYPGRGPCDTREEDWATRMFVTAYKEPLYKGGRVMERIPSWTDRIQYRSLPDRWGELLPESLDPSRPSASPHNYHVVNNGLDTSDHAPVYATFSLQISAEEVGEVAQQAALDTYVHSQQGALGYRQSEEEGGGGATIVNGGGAPDSLTSLAIPSSTLSGVMSDADFSALHPSVRPLVVVLRVGGVVVDMGGVGVVPRGMAVVFPLPYEDSDLVPERHKVTRASASYAGGGGMGGGVGGGIASSIGAGLRALLGGKDTGMVAASLRTVVSRASRLESLHLLLRVTLDDQTKCQCVIAMRDGGFVGAGSHMNTFKQPLTSNGVAVYAANGQPLSLQFTLEMHAYQRGGTQTLLSAPAPAAPSSFSAPQAEGGGGRHHPQNVTLPPKTPSFAHLTSNSFLDTAGGENYVTRATPFPAAAASSTSSATFRAAPTATGASVPVPSAAPPPVYYPSTAAPSAAAAAASAAAPYPTPSNASQRALALGGVNTFPGVDAEAARIKALKVMAAARAKAAAAQ